MGKENKAERMPTLEELHTDMKKISAFAKTVTQPILDAATKPDGYVDMALLFCGMGYVLEKFIDVVCKDNAENKQELTDFMCGCLKGYYERQ